MDIIEIMDDISNENMLNFYRTYNHIFKSINTHEDAQIILGKLKLSHIKNQIAFNLLKSQKKPSMFDYCTFMNVCKELENIKYRQNASEYLALLVKKTSDAAQINTFVRIINIKPLYSECTYKQVIKNCPHCNHPNLADINTTYIICGYNDNGYDWDGCQHDWCFQCGKILCKSWETNMLFVKSNRVHNISCCKEHAAKTNKSYPSDYCQCILTS